MAKRLLSKEQEQELLADRLSGMTRESICQKYGVGMPYLKTLLLRNKVVLPMEQRQHNAYSNKMAKNPNAMADMRKSLTPEVIARRSESTRQTYANKPELRELKKQQIRQYWDNKVVRSKYVWEDLRTSIEAAKFTFDWQSVADKNFDGDSSIKLVCHCGTAFDSRCFDVLYGKVSSCGCVKSHAEKEILNLVRSWGLKAECDRTVIAPQEIDVWIPSLNIGIEYCGLWAHGQRFKDNRYHWDKMKACEVKGIRLVTVFSDEWLGNKDAVVATLRAILGRPMKSVGARSCEFTQNRDVLRSFVGKHHLMGAGGVGQSYLGLVSGNEVVAAVAFVQKSEQVLEISRYCVSAGTAVAGGFQRLLARLREENPGVTKIVSFSDNRWSQGGIYERSGFKAVAELPPAYWYTKGNSDTWRKHRSLYRKDRIVAQFGPMLDGETEAAAMSRLGFDRIYDCGYRRWELDV